MKKILSIMLVFLISTSPIYTQTLMYYLDQLKGDTLVVKDYYQMNNQHDIQFDGSSLTSGVYIYTLRVKSYEASKKMMFIK